MTVLRERHGRGVDGDRLRACMRLFPTGVALLTVGQGDDVVGMTVNSVISVSLEPPLLLVSLHRRARITAVVRSGTCFSVGILGADQMALSRQFASASRPTGAAAVAAMAGRAGSGGVPAPAGCLGVAECVAERLIPVGDHVLLIGLVVHVDVQAKDRPPQVFFRSGFTTLAPGRAREGSTER